MAENPREWRATAGLIVTHLVSVLALAMEYKDLGASWQLWTTRALAVIVVVSNVLGLKVVTPKARAVVATVILTLIAVAALPS